MNSAGFFVIKRQYRAELRYLRVCCSILIYQKEFQDTFAANFMPETWTTTNCCLISHIFFVFIAWRDFPAKPSHCYVTHTTNRTERLTRSSLDIETRPPPFGSQSRGTHAEHVTHQLSSCLLKSSYCWTKRCGLLHGRPCVCDAEVFFISWS